MDRLLRDRLKRAYAADAAMREERTLPAWRIRERTGFLETLQRCDLVSILEIGAGVGRDARFFADHGCAVTCIDLSEKMIDLCRAKGLSAEVMDVVDLSYEDDAFDAAYSVNCLLHVPLVELPKALREIHRVLRPGALFYYGTWGGFEHEGVYEDDHLTPPRLFSFHDDAALKGLVSEVFEVLSFCSRSRDPEDSRFLFQSLLLRKPSHDTVERLKGAASMALKELVSTSNMADIALIKSLLDSEGIPYLAQGEGFHAVRPLIEPVRFLVAEEDLERARPLIEDIHLSFGAFADFQDGEGVQNDTP
jgi:SAM-dependent methyltransferase